MTFMMILIAGLGGIFKASLSAFVASSETVSSGRRNRMTLDMLYEDLNQVGMLPSTLFDYPQVDSTNPPFRITPNVAYTGTDVPLSQAKADQLDFYYDDILPFDGTLGTDLANTSDQVASESELSSNSTFALNFRDADQAQQVVDSYTTYGLYILFQSSGYSYKLTSASRSGSSVTATISSEGTYAGTGVSTGATFTMGGVNGSVVTLIRPGRYVRYSIKPKALDPSNPSVRTPCLIREEVKYDDVKSSTDPFATPSTSLLIAENISGFKVSLSGDGGNTWTGKSTDTTWSDITGPAASPVSPQLNWQLANSSAPARTGMRNTNSSPFWFREIPVLVRVDVTTRTANKRTEHTSTQTTADYKQLTQTLVLTPRHFGLAYQPMTY